MPKQIKLSPDTLPALLKGMQKVRQAVGATMGPNGLNCMYERIEDQQVLSTRDGVTVARQIELSDPFENIGAQTIREVADDQVRSCGDGTTLSVVLTEKIFSEGVKAISVGASPVAVKRGIEKASAAVVQQLKLVAHPVSTHADLQAVATISANNDPKLGNLIATAIKEAGEDGVVVCQMGDSPESRLEKVEGLQIGGGYIADEFITNEEKQECVLDDVYVLFHDRPLARLIPMMPVLSQIIQDGKSLLVIAEDVKDEALAILRANAAIPAEGQVVVDGQGNKGMRPRFSCCAIKAPGGLEHLKDLAALTRGKIVTPSSGITLESLKLEHLGHARRVIVRQGQTTIFADEGENPQLTRRIQELRTQTQDATNEFDRIRTKGRLGSLAAGIVTIWVGGQTELSIAETTDRIDDSMHAVRCAQEEGIIPGGGQALVRAASAIPQLEGDEKLGADIVRKACFEPLETIVRNSGGNGEMVRLKVQENSGLAFGFNARTGEYGNLYEMGVIDPVKVVHSALSSAASVAGLALITETLVHHARN